MKPSAVDVAAEINSNNFFEILVVGTDIYYICGTLSINYAPPCKICSYMHFTFSDGVDFSHSSTLHPGQPLTRTLRHPEMNLVANSSSHSTFIFRPVLSPGVP